MSLYIAAHYGHIDLATTMLRLGARPDEPVGVHPSREWCSLDVPAVPPTLSLPSTPSRPHTSNISQASTGGLRMISGFSPDSVSYTPAPRSFAVTPVSRGGRTPAGSRGSGGVGGGLPLGAGEVRGSGRHPATWLCPVHVAAGRGLVN